MNDLTPNERFYLLTALQHSDDDGCFCSQIVGHVAGLDAQVRNEIFNSLQLRGYVGKQGQNAWLETAGYETATAHLNAQSSHGGRKVLHMIIGGLARVLNRRAA